MNKERVIIIGAGPCGIAAALTLKKIGISPLIIEKENVVHAIYRYPTHQTFFSSSDNLEVGEYPFVTTTRKPKRNDALAYYREVVKRAQLRINAYETVETVKKENDETFYLQSVTKQGEKRTYIANYVIVATGYYDHPNMMGIPGEDLPHVFHYFKEAHPFFDKDVTIIGGKNSAVDATLELEKAGARVTVLYRGSEFSKSVKPWILPDFYSLVRKEKVHMEFEANVERITPSTVLFKKNGQEEEVKADFVFAMTGYHPDHQFLTKMGVEIEADTGRPVHNEETMETNVRNLFIAGVIAAGNNANEIFIENGRFHGEHIAAVIRERKNRDE